MPVRRVLAEVDADELSLWRAFDKVHPLDDVARLELAIATGTAFNVVAHGGEARDASSYLIDYGKRYRDVADVERTAEAARSDPDALAERIDAIFGGMLER
jgi:hypothetical protein